jgi:hypothetical protein
MMFSNPLIEIPIIELLRLWGELVEAYHSVNGFGGNVAEIYAYRLQRYSPFIHDNIANGDRRLGELLTNEQKAGNALVALIGEFCDQYSCKATVDRLDPAEWCKRLNFNQLRFDHRVYVEILR